MLGGASSLLHDCHSPVGGRGCSPVAGVEALRVRFSKAPLPLSMYFVLNKVSTEASEAHVVTAHLCAAGTGIRGSAEKQPKVMSLSSLCSS